MAKKAKVRRIASVRVDDDFGARVDNYVEATDMNISELMRKAIEEFMVNHPVKEGE